MREGRAKGGAIWQSKRGRRKARGGRERERRKSGEIRYICLAKGEEGNRRVENGLVEYSRVEYGRAKYCR